MRVSIVIPLYEKGPYIRRALESIAAQSLGDHEETVLDDGGQGMSSSSMLARANSLKACGGFPLDVPNGQDVDTWARLAWSGPIAYWPEPLAIYHSEVPNNATRRASAGVLAFPAV